MPDLTEGARRELSAIDDALAGRPVAPDLAHWEELSRLLRAERPAPEAGFAAALDARAARGFPDRPPAVRAARRSRRVRRGWPALGLAAAALLVGLVVALGDGGGRRAGDNRLAADVPAGSGGGAMPSARDGADEGAAQGSTQSAPRSPDRSAVAPLPPVAPPATGSPGSDARRRRTVERSATLTLAVAPDAVDAVSARVQATTRRLGGFVAASTVASGPDGGSFTLRIPSRTLDAALAALAGLGAVRERSQSAQDMTAAAVSTGRRLRDARAERAALLRRLATATTVNLTESLRRRLDIVGREIERARAARRRAAARGAFATVSLTLLAERRTGDGQGGAWTPGDAAADALRVLEVAAGAAVLALALGLPLGALAAVAVAAVRWSTRRRRERVLDAV